MQAPTVGNRLIRSIPVLVLSILALGHLDGTAIAREPGDGPTPTVTVSFERDWGIVVSGTTGRDEVRVYISPLTRDLQEYRAIVMTANRAPLTIIQDRTQSPVPAHKRNCRPARMATGLQNHMADCPLRSTYLDSYGGDDHVAVHPGYPEFLRIDGGPGNDVLWAANGSDLDDRPQVVFGGAGNDFIHGTPKHDWLFGGPQVNALGAGISDRDTIFGKAGDDILHGDEGDDALYGGGGDDGLFDDERSNSSIVPPLRGTLAYGNDRLTGGTGWDDFYSTRGVDHLFAKEGELRRMTYRFETGDATFWEIMNKPPGPDSLHCGQDTYFRRDLVFDRILTGSCKGELPSP